MKFDLKPTVFLRWLLRSTLACALSLTACGTLTPGLMPADRFFAAGELAAAEVAYRDSLRAEPSAAGRDHALFRLALIYSLPDSPLRDQGKAEATLSRLLAHYPSSEHAATARVLLAWNRRGDDVARQLEAKLEELERAKARVEELASAAGETHKDLEQHSEARQKLVRELATERKKTAELEAALAALSERATRLETELEQLKRVDLGEPPV